MDILAHTLIAHAAGKKAVLSGLASAKSSKWILIGAIAPDIVHAIPVLLWALAFFDLGLFWQYATALPGGEPLMPEWLTTLTCVLHCVMHSIVSLLVVTGILFLLKKYLAIYTLGWWMHSVLDIFTHSSEYYPVRPFYPISERAFDGIAWNEPVMLVGTYALIALIYVALYWRKVFPAR